MKTLTELVTEWRTCLVLTFSGHNQEWACSIFPCTMVDHHESVRPGVGATPQIAMADYAKKIRGKKIDLGSFKYPNVKSVPEVLSA